VVPSRAYLEKIAAIGKDFDSMVIQDQNIGVAI
jgi:hypothetical protein